MIKKEISKVISTGSKFCYQAQWQELINQGKDLVNNPDTQPVLLVTWITHGKFAAYKGNLVTEYKQLLTEIEARLQKELGEERTTNLLESWKKELDKFLESQKSPQKNFSDDTPKE